MNLFPRGGTPPIPYLSRIHQAVPEICTFKVCLIFSVLLFATLFEIAIAKAPPIGCYVSGPLKICFPCGRAAIQQQRNTEVTALLEYFTIYWLSSSIRVYRSYNVFSPFLADFHQQKVNYVTKTIKFSMLAVAQDIILKLSALFKNLMQEFTMSNFHIFKNTCGQWTRNIITNWSGLTCACFDGFFPRGNHYPLPTTPSIKC